MECCLKNFRGLELRLFFRRSFLLAVENCEVSSKGCSNKDLFLTRKKTGHERHLILTRVKKGEVIPDNTATKNYFPLFVDNYN